jgi:hypothetical protein
MRIEQEKDLEGISLKIVYYLKFIILSEDKEEK